MSVSPASSIANELSVYAHISKPTRKVDVATLSFGAREDVGAQRVLLGVAGAAGVDEHGGRAAALHLHGSRTSTPHSVLLPYVLQAVTVLSQSSEHGEGW